MSTRKELTKKILAMIVIIMLMVSNFGMVGKAAVSYAIDVIKTSSPNVELTAYFSDESGKELQSKTKNIQDGEESLYVKVGIKKEGYFSGVLEFENKNFEINREYLDSGVSEITEDGKVILKQINAGTDEVIEVKINPIKKDIMKLTELQNTTKVKLSGEYTSSKNIDSKKTENINGETEVKINWISIEESQLNIVGEVFTNKNYLVDGEEKKIVQVLVGNMITQNNYPIKTRIFSIKELDGVQDIKVAGKNEDQLSYTKQDGYIQVTIRNNNDEEIRWTEEEDILVTYILDKDADTLNKDINIQSSVELYDNKKIDATKIINTGLEKEGAITYEIEGDSELYKGKIQIGEAKQYKTQLNINVNYAKIAKEINMKTEPSIYKVGEKEEAANITYKETKINKESFLKIFGEQGYLTIRDANGVIIALINKDSLTDELGNVVINYASEIKEIQLVGSKPVENGVLVIENTKEIKENNNFSKVRKAEIIEEKIIANDETKEKNIELKDTTTEAELEVNTKVLSTLDTNEDVKMTITLLNKKETQELYKNPKLKVILPEEVEEINAKCKLLYGNGLTLGKTQIVKENGKQVINIELDGEQTKYNAEAVKGTKIIIYADLVLNELAPNAEKSIELEYTNEKASEYKNTKESKVEIQSRTGVILTNNIRDYGVKTIGNEGTKEIEIETTKTEKEAKVEISAINNQETTINDVRILGHFPTKAEDNLGIKLNGGIELQKEGTKIYYSDNENPTDDLNNAENGWSELGNKDTTKSYLILVNELAKGEKIEASYDISAPADIIKNTKASENYGVTYTSMQTGKRESLQATTIKMLALVTSDITDQIPGLEMTVQAIIGNDIVGNGSTEKVLGSQIAKGEMVQYNVTLKNVGERNLSNIELTQKVSDNGKIKLYEIEEDGNSYDFTNSKNNPLVTTIEQLDRNQIIELQFYALAENTGNLTTEIQAKSGEQINRRFVVNNVVKSNLQLVLESMDELCLTNYIPQNHEYEVRLEITNTSNTNLNNVNVEFLASDLLKINGVRIGKEDSEMIPNITSETINIKARETAYVFVYIEAKEEFNEGEVWLYGKATENGLTTRSNKMVKEIGTTKFDAKLKATNEGEVVVPGQEIEFTIDLGNGHDALEEIEMDFNFSIWFDIEQVIINDKSLAIQEDIEEEMPKDEENKESEDIPEDKEVDEEYLEQLEKEAAEEKKKWEENCILTENPDTGDQVIQAWVYDIEPNKNTRIKIIAKVVEDAAERIATDIEMESKASVEVRFGGTNPKESNKVIHYLKTTNVEPELPPAEEPEYPGAKDPNEPTNPDNPEDPDNQNNPDNPSNPSNPNSPSNPSEPNNQENPDNPNNPSASETKTYTISGIVWKDENENGRKDSYESIISGIEVNLINADTAKIVQTTTTDTEGKYKFDISENGRYIIMFKVDADTYIPTAYQADGSDQNKNSDATTAKFIIDGKELTGIITDTIEISNGNIDNIDLGLKNAKVFDLELSKTINKVTIKTEEGTKVTNYDNATFARAEINTKYIQGAVVEVEYNISVKNTGEVAGYAKSIVDYKPTDLVFDNKTNTDWYQSGDNLYNNSLADIKIEPGETKELKLILTKTMTEENMGLVNNLAEIAESYNTQGILDKDSTAGNKQKGEDDLGESDVTIGIKTGTTINYIIFTLSAIVILMTTTYIICKKILKANIKF